MDGDFQSSFLRMKKTVQAESVLGCVLKDPKVGNIVVESLKVEDFIDPTHKKIFGAISEIVKRGDEPSKHVIAGFFTDKELALMGGSATLDRLERGAPNPTTVLTHIKGVQEQTLRKKIYRGLDRAKEKLNSMGPTVDALKEISELSREVSERMNSESGDIAEVFDKWKLEPDLMGTSTGFLELDKLTGGMKPGTLWVVAAYLGCGKTHFMIKTMNNIQLVSKDKCLFFSLEMQSTRVVKRMAWDLTCRYMPEEKLKEFNVKLFNNKRTISDIEYAIMTNNPKVVFIDYVQLITSSGKSLFEQMESTSRELQRIAQEYCCCVMVATQVSNDYAKEPSSILSSKGGQGLSACADVFVELFRQDMQREAAPQDDPIVEVTMNLRKNRDGQVKKLDYLFDTSRGFIMMSAGAEGPKEVVEMDFGLL